MAEYWKSTPSYWCKFCHQYVKDTPIERKNHDASARHQNNIQRSLRELHKGKEREDREKQRAKDEVARLNGLVSGKRKPDSGPSIQGLTTVAASSGPALNAAAQRKKHAEQLAAMGVELPEELKKEITGVGGWETVSERVVEGDQANAGRSLADIVKQENENKEDANVKGVHKRKADEEAEAEAQVKQRKVWGSSLKTYPVANEAENEDDGDLDTLLSGVGVAKKRPVDVKQDNGRVGDAVDIKNAENSSTADAKSTSLPMPGDGTEGVKEEDEGAEAITAPPVVMFKKRKAKK